MHILPQAARLLALRPRPVGKSLCFYYIENTRISKFDCSDYKALWGMTVSVPRRYFSQPRVLYQESVLAANDQKPSTSGTESVPANDQSTEAKSVDESTPSKKKKKSKFYLSKSGQWRKKNRSRKSQKDLPPPEDRKSLVELLNPFMTQATQLRAELRKIAQEKNIEISLTDVEKFNQEIKDTNKKFTNFVEAANLSEAFAKEIGRIINRTAREALATTKDEFKKLVNQTRVIENRLKNEEGRYSQLRGMIESNAWKAVKDKQKVIVQFTLLPLHKAALLKKVAKAILANDSPLSTADSASIPTLLSNNRDKYAEVGLSNAEEMDWISKEVSYQSALYQVPFT